MSYKVYVMLGFHINFYHSWRGDTPDEAGFGTDMRVIRRILDILDRANASGKQARGYWDTEVYWTFQEILPKHCPDILERMRARVAAGIDEIVLGPFNNGANHAATADEFRAAVNWAIENPWGSGLRQLFPKVAPFYRPQECMFTTGQEAIFKEYGVAGLLLYYAVVPFNSLGAFIPVLSLEERYNPLWFRSSTDQPRLVLFPAMSAGDVIDMVSLENMMLDLHDRQQHGAINSDVVIHLNEDADLETWLPMNAYRSLKWFPNLGGLEEYIALVNKYSWADFTVPSEYLAGHPPHKEILVRQDLADGAFDGSYSWAEKCSSIQTWSILEQSRLVSYRAAALAKRSGLDLSAQLWEGMDSSFFKRLIGLSTTHFGMSTPVINEERQARALSIVGESRRLAGEAERKAARVIQNKSNGALYDFELFPTPPNRDADPEPARVAVRVPLILPASVTAIQLEGIGQPIHASLTDRTPVPGGSASYQARFVTDLGPTAKRYRALPTSPSTHSTPVTNLKNEWLDIEFSEQTGVRTFKYCGVQIGGMDFLLPFVSYRTKQRPVVYPATQWEFLPLEGEQWDGLQRVRLRAYAPMQTPHGEYTNQFTYTFTLFDSLPHLYVDVEAKYASTLATQIIHNMTQKLRRLMDLRWVEVAPFQVHPSIESPPISPLRIWKHNYLGITAWYELNYGQINARNKDLDAFNHQVTAGWVAVTDGKHGLLLAENAETLTSMAFCPMRLREGNGTQRLWLNPFGSYHGKMMDYSHLGGSGIGSDILQAFSGFLKPNGPSFNGQTLRFTLMLAPYSGNEPPAALQAAAAAHFYPPGVVFHTTPEGIDALLPGDISTLTQNTLRQAQIETQESVPAPTAFLANSAAGQVNLVWDLPRDIPVTGFEIAWHLAGKPDWQIESIPAVNRWQVTGLQDKQVYIFKLRAACGSSLSDWTAEQTCVPGAVTGSGLGSLAALPIWSLLRVIARSLWSVLKVKVRIRGI
jgi:hypothetical protein